MLGSLADRGRRILGYRGTALVFLGLVWFAVGARVLDPDDDPAHKLPIEYLPIWLRVGIWWAAAGVAIIVAFWPPGRTRWGYMALVIPAAIRAASYVGAFIFGFWGAWVDAVVWGGIVGYVMLCADWPEPPTLNGECVKSGAL